MYIMNNKFFMHRAKETKGVVDKGTETHETYDSAKQAYHAYLGAYAYGREKDTTFVQCLITDKTTHQPLMGETWNASESEPEPEQ